MTRIAKAALKSGLLALAIAAPQAASGQATPANPPVAGGAEFARFLPHLPGEVPWLAALRRSPHRDLAALPEAGTVSALMFVPQRAEGWAPLTSQPAALRSSGGCTRC
jgi:hypothetical protein